MRGIIWKYLADPNDPELRDEMGREGCRVLNPDPDFWKNPFPVWAICGPRVRATLEEEDVIFFTPTAERIRRAGLQDYCCTGVLTVEEVLADDNILLSDHRFSPSYRKNYRIDLARHLRGDPRITRSQRRQHIVIGSPSASAWHGRNGPILREALRRARVRDINLTGRRVRNLSDAETTRLFAAVRGR